MTPSNQKLLAKIKAKLNPPVAPVDPGAAMERVRERIEIIAARLRAQPGWKEPSAAERAATLKRLYEAVARHTAPAA
jgi:acyl-CoA reductase-like NAD-dependent aldehyde dehydrogenase